MREPRLALRAGRRVWGLGAVVTIVALGWFAPAASQAQGVSFQRGDLLADVTGSIDVFAPDGTLQGTFADGTAGGDMCFNPNATRLVMPGVALFDTDGNELPSQWAAEYGGGCAVDGYGHVFDASGPYGTDPATGATFGTITEYTLNGRPLRQFTVAAGGDFGVGSVDLAPDDCTAYYLTGLNGTEIGSYNVCTQTQGPLGPSPGPGPVCDQLHVLANFDLAVVCDTNLSVFSTSGQSVYSVGGPTGLLMLSEPSLRFLAVDPDATDLWLGTNRYPDDYAPVCSVGTPDDQIWHIDTATNTLLTTFRLGCGNVLGGLAVYGPPLLGDANIASVVDSNPPGMAEAFSDRVGYSGSMTSLHVYLDATSASSTAEVGVYSNQAGHPGTLLADATIASPLAGSWNDVPIGPLAVTAGERLWIALLGPAGEQPIEFRDATVGQGSWTSAQLHLGSLPEHWSVRTFYDDGGLSAYGD